MTRYAVPVGSIAAGPPTTGTFVVDDVILDQAGVVWLCTVSGSPGTWTQTSTGGGIANDFIACNYAGSTGNAGGSVVTPNWVLEDSAGSSLQIDGTNANKINFLSTGFYQWTYSVRCYFEPLGPGAGTDDLNGTIFTNAVPNGFAPEYFLPATLGAGISYTSPILKVTAGAVFTSYLGLPSALDTGATLAVVRGVGGDGTVLWVVRVG